MVNKTCCSHTYDYLAIKKNEVIYATVRINLENVNTKLKKLDTKYHIVYDCHSFELSKIGKPIETESRW